MGSCFRFKSKKNSYTVNQVDEYSPSGGTYQTKDQWGSKGKSRGNTTNGDVIISQKVKEERHNDVMVNQNYVVKENGVHTEDQKVPTPEPSPPPSPEHVHHVTESPVHEVKHKTPSPPPSPKPTREAKIAYVPVVEDIPVEDEPREGKRHESVADIDQVPMHAVVINESLEEPMSPTGVIDLPDVLVESRHSLESSDDDREDPVEAREEYFARREVEEDEYPVIDEDVIIPAAREDIHEVPTFFEDVRQDVLITHEPHDIMIPEIRIQDNDDVINSQEDIQMNESPAGTWDARLNKDVRAELQEESQSREGSQTNSTISLEEREHQHQHQYEHEHEHDHEYDHEHDHEHNDVTEKLSQRVQFDVPDTDDEDTTTAGVSVISITNETHEEPGQHAHYATSYESYEVGEGDEVNLDTVGDDDYDVPGQMTSSDNHIVTSVEYTVKTD